MLLDENFTEPAIEEAWKEQIKYYFMGRPENFRVLQNPEKYDEGLEIARENLCRYPFIRDWKDAKIFTHGVLTTINNWQEQTEESLFKQSQNPNDKLLQHAPDLIEDPFATGMVASFIFRKTLEIIETLFLMWAFDHMDEVREMLA